MSARARGVLLAVVQVALLAGVGGRYLVDRTRYPHGWARAAPYDPDLPIRGRYLSLAVDVERRGPAVPGAQPVALEVDGDRVVARPVEGDEGGLARAVQGRDPSRVRLEQTVAFSLPEHVADPSRRPAGEELWVEVTITPGGTVRPLRLGVMRDGVLEPLVLD